MNFQKMVLVPSESVSETINPENPDNPKKRIERDSKKLRKLLNIVLKISLNNSYTEDFEIKDKLGNPIRDSDVSVLLNNAIIPQKVLIGENDFIRILSESKVDPNWIVNENLRIKLLNYRPNSTPKPPPKSPPNFPPKTPNLSVNEMESHSIEPDVRLPVKRKIVDTAKDDKRRRTQKPWEIPLPEDDDDDL